MMKLAALVALTVIAFTGISHAETCTVADPSGTPLNVRKSPDGAILGALSNGVRVTTWKQRGDWVRIDTRGGRQVGMGLARILEVSRGRKWRESLSLRV